MTNKQAITPRPTSEAIDIQITAEQVHVGQIEQHDRDNGRSDEALIESAHDVVALAQPHEEDRDDRRDDRACAQDKGVGREVRDGSGRQIIRRRKGGLDRGDAAQ
jgi:hypothetical protein